MPVNPYLAPVPPSSAEFARDVAYTVAKTPLPPAVS